MRRRDAWKKAFPFNEAERAVKYLAERWVWVSNACPDELKHTRSEPQITADFCDHLDRHKRNVGKLTGFWQNEAPKAIRKHATAPVKRRLRTDITYLCHIGGNDLILVFEFKKLTASKRSNYIRYGVKRFVDDYYAPGEAIAIMVGMMKSNGDAQKRKLKLSLHNKGTRRVLRMVPDRHDVYVRQPSEFFPNEAEFSTEHNRPGDQAPPGGTTTVAHIFVQMLDPKP